MIVGKKKSSNTTHPTIPCADVLEAVVLADCLEFLRKLQITCDRNNVGTFDTRGGLRRFGIKDAGDIIGIIPLGRHFEIEVKRGRGGVLSEGQQKRKFKILSNNGIYLIVHSAEELEKLFLPFLERK